jgi:hypothetical protein
MNDVMQNAAKPAVWTWYIVYCAFMAFMYFAVIIAGVVFMFFVPNEDPDVPMNIIIGVLYMVLGLIFMVIFAIAPFLPKAKWSWIYGFVMIGIGMTSVCCLPASIPLLIYWLKPETKRFFNMAA